MTAATHLFRGQPPRRPMHPDRPLAPDMAMQLDRVLRRAMYRRHDPPRVVRSDRDHAQIERALTVPDLGKDGAGRAVFRRGVARDASVASVAAEPDFAARAGVNGPGRPERVVSLQ